jgi:hypothetical protein
VRGRYREAIEELQKSLALAPEDKAANRALEQVRLEVAKAGNAQEAR